MEEALIIYWLHSAAVFMAENSRPVHNVQPGLLHAHLGEKSAYYVLEGLQYQYTQSHLN